jgi:hypothetical protein
VKIVTLAEPGVPESHVLFLPPVQEVVRYARRQVNGDRRVLEALGPRARGRSFALFVGNAEIVKKVREFGRVISNVRLGVHHHRLGVRRILAVCGSGQPQDAREIRQSLVGPTSLTRVVAQECMPPADKRGCRLTIFLRRKDPRFFEEPPDVDTISCEDHDARRKIGRQDRQRLLDGRWEGRLGMSIRPKIQVGPETDDSGLSPPMDIDASHRMLGWQDRRQRTNHAS